MSKQSLKVVSDKATDSPDTPEPSLRSDDPVIITAIGRQRVGKTALLNALVQIAQMRGAELDIWNCDLLNRSHSLTTFHKAALVPPIGQTKDQRSWIEARIEEQIESRRDAVLDVGGGWTALHELIEETPLVELLEEANVSLVAVYVLGTEAGDVDYLDTLLNKKAFLPKKSLIVLNEGLVASGRSPLAAFEPIINHPVVRKARDTGAVTAFMPALSCMAAVTDRGLSFSDFADGTQTPGLPRTSIFDRARVRRWFENDMPGFFNAIPSSWLPRLRDGHF